MALLDTLWVQTSQARMLSSGKFSTQNMEECEVLAVWAAAIYANLCFPSWSTGILYTGVKLQNHLSSVLVVPSNLIPYEHGSLIQIMCTDMWTCVREIMDKK